MMNSTLKYRKLQCLCLMKKHNAVTHCVLIEVERFGIEFNYVVLFYIMCRILPKLFFAFPRMVVIDCSRAVHVSCML